DYYSYSSTPWYSYRTGIKTVDIQQGVTSIGYYAFYGCSNLTTINVDANMPSSRPAKTKTP
ncbi:MAG: leucine-rich repeat domain-containing protein, partial [Dysgonamonadaceae bacterium]|nr:leucine-rich repeat domain-containing protein [Dysgonamonadaceae bacterium]